MRTCISLFFLLIFSGIQASAQLCSSQRFTETYVYDAPDLFADTNIVYGHAINWAGVDETLSLSICYPKTSIDTMARRPMVFLIHGGGFVSGDRNDLNQEAYLFARRGFIGVTIDYRLGRDCSGPDTLSYDKAVYRAIQDANAALRFLVNQADLIGLDTNWIFIGGSSAGAGTCLAMVYSSQAELNADHPTLQAILGNIDNSTNTFTNTFTIQGIFNNWGGVSSDHFEKEEAVPTISFHGDADLTVDIDSAYGSSCINPPIVYGSNLIYQHMLSWGACNQTSVKIGGGHGVYNNSSASTDFRVAKASCFFKSVMCGSCYSYDTTDSIPATCSTTLAVETETEDVYQAYPNPVKDILYIKTTSSNTLPDLYVYNMHGSIICSAIASSGIPVDGLATGIYILQVRENKNGSVKNILFIKE